MVAQSLAEVPGLAQTVPTVRNMLILLDAGGEKRNFYQGQKVFLLHISGGGSIFFLTKEKNHLKIKQYSYLEVADFGLGLSRTHLDAQAHLPATQHYQLP